jgi:N utilization substance protein A
MARKKASGPTKEEQFNAVLNYFKQVAATRNLEEDVVVKALLEAIKRVMMRTFGGEGDRTQGDVDVEVVLDDVNYEIRIYYFKNVVDVVNDDALEISKEDFAKLENPLMRNDKFVYRTLTTNDLNEMQMKNVQNQFISQLRDLEKEQLIKKFSTKIGELVMGKIEIISNRTTMVNLGDVNVLLDENNHTINHEKFPDGAFVPFLLKDVVSTPRGANIVISRTDPLFVKRLMEREIPEIYDGTVVIRDIARIPGNRCKVAVESVEPNVDPVGACIGPGGSRIQKVSAELGPTNYKEKIDIIPYSDNIGLFIMDAFLPAEPLGINIDEENKKATVVVEIGDKGKAIGKGEGNIRTAKQLTGYDNIEVLELNEATLMGLDFKTRETLVYEQNLIEQERATVRRFEQLYEQDEDELPSEEFSADITVTDEEVEHAPETETTVNSTVNAAKPAPTEVKAEEPEPKVKAIKTTISLAELEAELEKDKKEEQKQVKKTKKRYDDKGDEKVSKSDLKDEHKPTGPKMDIYTEEELAEIKAMEEEEKENEEAYYDDIDYEDFDEYYDDK